MISIRIPARLVLSTLAAGLLALPAPASTRYVDASLATGANTGSSWSDAFQGVTGLQSALAVATAGDQIWVAQGTYKPTATATRSIYFALKTGVEIYGGFAGGETLLAQRDFAAHLTILSADLGGNDGSNIFTDNSFHVIDGASATATAVLDGFTVRGGNANGGGANQDRGGGALLITSSNATFRNCVFSNNRCTFGGGQGYIFGSGPTFDNVAFEGGQGGSFGGAFDMNTGSNTSFRRCVFTANSAARAGAVEIFNSSNVTLTNCLFFGNTATGSSGGGAVWVGSGASATLRFCTLVGNSASSSTGAGLLVTGATANVANSILYFNTGPGGTQSSANQVQGATVTYSCVQAGFAGTGNISADPVLPFTGAGDYRIGAGSPCIDAGNNAAIPVGTIADLIGYARAVDDPLTTDTGAGTPPLCDLGCYEYQPPIFQAFCFGDGLDPGHTTPCPCANTGAAGNGCANSVEPGGANLVASGSAAGDDVVLSASAMPGTAFGLYMQHDAADDRTFHDGVLCAGGTLIRLRGRTSVGGASSFPSSVDTQTLSQRGQVASGSGLRRYYAVWYRNASTTYCPPATANVTNGWLLDW